MTFTARQRAILAVVTAAALFGTTGTAQALGPESATPLGVGTIRVIIGAAGLWFITRYRPAKAGSKSTGLTAIRDTPPAPLVALGAVGVAIYQPGFFIGTQRSGVALGTILALGSAPIFTGAFEWAWFRRRPSHSWVMATTAMMLGGILLIVGRGGTSAISLVGTIGSLGAGCGYALYALATKGLIERGIDSTRALAWQFGFGALLLLPLLTVEPMGWLTTPSGLAMALQLGLVATALAYFLYGIGLRLLDTTTAVTITLAEPMVAGLAAVVLLGERLRWYGWAGAGIVIFGLYLVGRPAKPARP